MNLKVKDEKIVGFVLLIAGLFITGYGISLMFNISQGFEVSIEILQSNEEITIQNTETGDTYPYNNSAPDINLEQMFTPLFPMLNFMIWLMIAFFIFTAGIRVVRIGIKMMKVSVELGKITNRELEEVKYISHLLKHH